jgi:hypothetical protein
MSTHAFANTLGPDLYHTHSGYLRRLFYNSKHNANKRSRATRIVRIFFQLALIVNGTANTSNRVKAFVFAHSYMVAGIGSLLVGASFILAALSNLRIL